MNEKTRRLAAILGLLIGLTLLSTEWIPRVRLLTSWQVKGALILAIAFWKVRIVALDFMELRRAPRALRGIMEAWILIVYCGIVCSMVW